MNTLYRNKREMYIFLVVDCVDLLGRRVGSLGTVFSSFSIQLDSTDNALWSTSGRQLMLAHHRAVSCSCQDGGRVLHTFQQGGFDAEAGSGGTV